MTPEDKMLERFAREKQKSHKKSSMFDLEDDGPEEGGLTHMGKSLAFGDDEPVDDFQEDDLEIDDDSDGSIRERQRLKRVRAMVAAGDVEEDREPERKKTKKEVMEEVIAKSKFYKMERQEAKEEDTDLRAELDKELSNIQVLLSSRRDAPRRNGEESAIATIAGVERSAFERDFDLQVKKLAQDKRAQPADRTKTEEEKAEEESKKLKELEDKRQRRMRGEEVTDSEDEENAEEDAGNDFERISALVDGDDDDDFGLGSGLKTKPTAAELGFDEEDDFVIEDDLVASGSDLELAESDEESGEDADHEYDEDEEDDGFTKGLLNEEESRNPVFDVNTSTKAADLEAGDEHGLPFTFPCPQSCAEFESISATYPHESLPTIIQRIRALYHPKLDSKNKERLARFSEALVDFISVPWDRETSAPFSVLESVVRHIHSLTKMFPIEVSKRFRYHLEEMERLRPLDLQPADLILLSAVGTIFPTSDHFHQVVTPAMLAIARYLGQKVPQRLSDSATGSYLSILALQFQQLSKRYVPEVVNFSLNAISGLSPAKPASPIGNFPLHESPADLRASACSKAVPRRLNFADCVSRDLEEAPAAVVKVSVLDTSCKVLDVAVDTWAGKSGVLETFGQAREVITHLTSAPCRSQLPLVLRESADKLRSKLERTLKLAQISRRPLELHHHRPLAIKMYIPKFEDTFDPDKHYDPDRERAELAKLKAEHKKERKGAMRELRKDANFMARENLRQKKAKDEAYEKKYKRLVAEIQSEEGKESNEYEREKKARKRARNR